MESKENKKSNLSWPLVVFMLALLMIVGFCSYKLGEAGRKTIDDENLQKGGNTSANVDVTEETEGEETDTTYKELTSEEIKKLYDDVYVLNDQLTEEYGYFEKINGKITSNQISDKAKLILAYKKLLKDNSQKIGSGTSFTKKQMSETAKKLFGNNVTYRDSEFVIYNQTVTFDNDKYFEKKGDTKFVSPRWVVNGNGQTLTPAAILTERISEKQEKGKLIIEEKYLEQVEIKRENISESILKQTFGIYKEVGDYDNNVNSYIDSYICETGNCNSNGCEINNCQMKYAKDYLDKLNTVRYTFNSDKNGNYYLESVEVTRV